MSIEEPEYRLKRLLQASACTCGGQTIAIEGMNCMGTLGSIRTAIGAAMVSVAALLLPTAGHAVPVAADIVFVVDESGSMDTEHDWLNAGGAIPSVVPLLESALLAKGVGAGADANRYALVGYGSSNTHSPLNQVAHKHTVGGGEFGSATNFTTAANGLTSQGGTEDGYQAIDFALNQYTYRTGNFARQVILITDEDRDINPSTNNSNTSGNALNFAIVQEALRGADFTLNVIVNNGFRDGAFNTAMGVDADGTAYLVDGAGGFTTAPGGVPTGGTGTTKADYIDLAHQLGGAAWDLNIMRSGGTSVSSFTGAFIAVKVEEIINTTTIPEPPTLLLLGTGLMIAGGLAMRRRGNLMVRTALRRGRTSGPGDRRTTA